MARVSDIGDRRDHDPREQLLGALRAALRALRGGEKPILELAVCFLLVGPALFLSHARFNKTWPFETMLDAKGQVVAKANTLAARSSGAGMSQI